MPISPDVFAARILIVDDKQANVTLLDSMLRSAGYTVRLTGAVRAEDTVARLGGDEFVIVLRVSGPADAAQVAGKVIAAVARPYPIGAQSATVTVSAGIGLYPTHGEDAASLLRSADAALYAAKRSGKNVYCVANP